jgi:hypothetical protein
MATILPLHLQQLSGHINQGLALHGLNVSQLRELADMKCL